ncbi:MAG: collagen-like protein, partial [Oscillospiraceae bacterium]|nr:collagen-like protein [Oscillospiraceae bacterium]
MAKVLIGNFKGPKGDKGDKGDRGPQGPKGEQGPVGLVNADAAIEFEDYTTEGVEVPTPEAAMAEIVSGKSLKGIISNIKAFFKGVVTLGMIVNNLDDVLAVEEGTVLPVGCKALQEVSAKIQLLMYVKTDVKQLNAGNNSFIVEPPSV